MSSYSQFYLKFSCHGNGGRYGENAIGSIQWLIPENPLIDAKISQIFLHKPSYSHSYSYPKFRCHNNPGGSGVKLNTCNTIKLAIPENHT